MMSIPSSELAPPPRKEAAFSPTPGAGTTRRTVLLLAVIISIAVAAVYAQTLKHEFVNLDDILYVAANPSVNTGLSWRNVEWAFTQAHAANWHPLTWMSHMLDCDLFGVDAAGGHHATNVVIHAAAAVLLLVSLRRMTGDEWGSGFVAAAFALHPLRVESVAWVSERKDVLSGLFFALTLLTYARYVELPSVGRYLLVAFCLSLGLLSKPMLVTLPCVLLLLDYWPFDRLASGRRAVRWAVLEKLPLMAVVAASAVATVFAQSEGRAVARLENLPMEVRLSNAVVSYVVYLWQTAWPFDLAAYYPHPENTLTFAQILGACGLMLTVTVCAVRLRRTRPALLVGWLWYLGMLVPVIGVVQVGSQGHADRYTYLPQVGLWVAVVWGVPWRSMLGLRPLAGLAILLLALWSVQSARQVEHWRDSETLFTHSLACTGPNSVALSALGSAIAAQGRWKESVKLLREAVALPGADDQAHFMLGLSLGHLGREGEAATHFRIAYEMNPNRADAKANLIVAHANEGTLLAQKGELREALRHLNAALALDPEYVPARKNKALVCLNLGLGFGRSGKPREAVGAFREAVRSDPDLALAHLNLGVALLEVGDFTAAANAFRAVLRLVPNDPRARAGLAESLGKISP